MECTAAVGDFPSKRKMQGVLRTNYDRPTSAALITGRQRRQGRRSIYRDPKLCCGKSVVSHNTTYCCVWVVTTQQYVVLRKMCFPQHNILLCCDCIYM